ncbi:MAG: cell surface protein [Fermentimonas sp.]|nr:cell surface protein [Fermentimonas sp.]
MKKSYFFKFFVFALVGALAILPSCKDYDDDISGLETSVSTVKSDLTALQTTVSSAQSAATAAQSTATDALAKANEALAAAQAAGDAEAISALEGQIADFQVELDAINDQLEALSGLEARIDALMEELKLANEAQLEAIIADVAAMTAQVDSMIGNIVTDVELIITSNNDVAIDLTFAAVLEQDNVFETGIANAITFKEGNQIQSPTSFVIRVSPTNAVITPEMVTLQNSLGIAYENLEILSVKPYEQLLTRATNGAGLWEVTVQLSEYNEDDFLAATVNEDAISGSNQGKILFAVAVDNSQTEENPLIRKVVSSYDITLDWSDDFDGANELDFLVDETSIDNINNRFDFTSQSLLNYNGTATPYAELVWSDVAATDAITSGANQNVTSGDDRTTQSVYPAVQGRPMKISIVEGAVKTIRAIYVTLDKQANAVESAPSEWNAWQGYSYTGLNSVVEGTETEIVINNNSAINDMIGFRVYAVNFDGTLVDPDGKAFYVSLGAEGADWGTVNTVITPESETVPGVISEDVNKTLTAITGATTFEWTTDEDADENTPAFHVVLEDADGELFTTDGGVVSSVDFTEVTKLHTVPTASSWLAYEDNKVYNGTLIVKNATGHVIATLKVSMKKVLPTGAPSGFSIKTSQLSANGVYNAYLVPNTWTAPNATQGTMPLGDVFTFTGDALASVANFDVIFADAARSGDDIVDLTVNPGNSTLNVAKEFINNTTQHETSVVYNYGDISTAQDGVDYVIEVENFPTVFNNIYNDTYSWEWDEDFETEIVYGSDATISLAEILGTSERDSNYDAPLSAPYLGSLSLTGLNGAVGGAKLYSNGTELEEYFTASVTAAGVVLTEASGSSNPTANVASTLVITVFDMYGHEVEIELPITVLKR